MARRRPFGGGRTDGRDARLRRAVLDDCCHAVSLGGGVGPRPFSGDRDYNRRMRTSTFTAAALAGAIAVPAFVSSQTGSSDVSPRARQLHERAIVVDTHDDTTQRLLFEKNFDIGVRHTNGNIDIPRMKEGGLDALFFSIWVPSDVTGPPAVRRLLDLIDTVRE